MVCTVYVMITLKFTNILHILHMPLNRIDSVGAWEFDIDLFVFEARLCRVSSSADYETDVQCT